MLTETFLHLSGVAAKTEQRLWAGGSRDWWSLVCPLGLFGGDGERFPGVKASIASFNQANWTWLGQALPQEEHWRALCLQRTGESLPLRWLALDIETSGTDPGRDVVTAAGICGHATGFQPVALVQERDLSSYSGPSDAVRPLSEIGNFLNETDVLITFNGKYFDLPFLRGAVRGFQSMEPPFHLDLMFTMRKLGIKGGLKKIQQRFGFFREGELTEVDGYMAVRLYRAHRRGAVGAFDTLVRYCLEDVVVLLPLAEIAYNLRAEELGRDWKCWTPPQVSLKELPFHPNIIQAV